VDNSTILQILLLLNVFFMGALAVVAFRHAYAHFWPHAHEPEKPAMPAVDPLHLPAEVKESLIHEAQANFLAVLNGSVGELEHDLKDTAVKLTTQLEELGSQVATTESTRYAATLEALRQQTEAALTAAQSEISQHQADLKARLTEQQNELQAKLAEQMAAEQQQLIKQIDTKLADAVASFLTETLQHNVDLGAQTAYLTATLEEHKDEFKREIAGDGDAANTK
jgi:F0F1-type ATP synthase membrane subunit b/b'